MHILFTQNHNIGQYTLLDRVNIKSRMTLNYFRHKMYLFIFYGWTDEEFVFEWLTVYDPESFIYTTKATNTACLTC